MDIQAAEDNERERVVAPLLVTIGLAPAAAGARRAKDAAHLEGVLVHLDGDGRIRWETVISSAEAEAA